MSVEHFKMCRVWCDGCNETYFEVFTYDRVVSAPKGWKKVTYWNLYSQRRVLDCCPSCVELYKRGDDVEIVDDAEVDLEEKS